MFQILQVKKKEEYIQMVFVAIALRIAITSEEISFYSTGIKSAPLCIIAMRIFKFLLMWRGPILPAAYF